MAWWMWALLGFGLVACEMLTPGGFYFLFFGIGALATGGLAWLGITGTAWVEWFLFTVISLVCLVPLRGRLVRWATAGEPREVDSLVGQETLVLEDVAPGSPGKGELRGTTWTVRSGGARALRRGERVRVVRVDGLTLWVE